MTLDQAKKGSEVEIVAIIDGASKSKLIRMGLAVGDRVICQNKLPLGPVVLRHKRQEIAIGRQLARGIIVK